MSVIRFIHGFRKWTLMAALMVFAVIFRFFNYISGAEFVDLMKGTMIAFVTANVGEHITTTLSGWLSNKLKQEDSSEQ